MPEINVDLCGRNTTITCADNDMARLQTLIEIVGHRADAARDIVGDDDHWRQLLFAAIFLADELDTAGAPTAAAMAPSSASEDVATRIAQLSTRISAALDRIDSALSSGVEPAVRNA